MEWVMLYKTLLEVTIVIGKKEKKKEKGKKRKRGEKGKRKEKGGKRER